ncbi:MAG: hypothetical protein AABX54_05370 [Nanoarchaeota archaeon]
MEYGIVRERSEGETYLMRRLEDRPSWCLAVAVLVKNPIDDTHNWRTENFPLYSVLWNDVTPVEEGLAEKILNFNSGVKIK